MPARCWLYALVLAASALAQEQAIFDRECAAKKFMGAVSVWHHGKSLFEGACGFANAEWEIGNTVETKFRAASISKQFTAAAVLLLQQDGKLSVSDSIGKFIDGLPPAWQSTTVHQLLTHTSGVPIYTAAPIRHLDRMGATPRELLDVVIGKPLMFMHGTKLVYNNTGYVLLGLVIEKASGMSYADFVYQRVFGPALMKDSGFDESRRVLSRRANGYNLKGDILENAEQVDASVAWSAGGFYSTVRDLVRWALAVRSGKLLNAASRAQMFRIYPETMLQGMHYGYGIVIAERFGKRLFYHGGGINGFSSVLQIYPDADLVIAVMSNLDSGSSQVQSWTVADGLAKQILKK